MSTLRRSVVINQFGIRFLRPAFRGLINLVRKGAYGNRDRDTPWIKKASLIFPIKTSRRDRCLGQPVESDVFKNIISSQPFRLTVEHPGNECLTTGVVI